jgi:hypothetical protein
MMMEIHQVSSHLRHESHNYKWIMLNYYFFYKNSLLINKVFSFSSFGSIFSSLIFSSFKFSFEVLGLV